MHLEITTRILTHLNTAKTFTTKYPLRGDHFDRSLIPALVESTWKQILLSLQLTSSSTVEHIESTACLVSYDHLYSTNS